ncbi:anti-sigma factor family protein [Chelatococcus sp. GCM10030263]|uniref:anti-sigma factor family protein n=1 Tax=Chelatococcus sp. GCM10030263 TaxID=3273387 RepID=UPI00366F3F56
MTSGRPISEDDLNAYVDRALDAARQAEVEAYLAAHPDVARRVAGFARQRDQLREAFAPIAQEPVPPELSLTRMIEARRRPARDHWRVAAAAVLLLAAGAGGGWLARGSVTPPASGLAALAREASDSYKVFSVDQARPVEIRAADQADLVNWISTRLQHPVAVPDLAASGFRFMGGRLVATAHGPAGLLMYDNDKGMRLVMLVRPMATDKNAPMAPHDDGSVAGFAWAENGIGYSLVGPAAPDVLHPLADEVRRQMGRAA